MIEESQNIEHKESWRDEYLKWICGFANAQGGRVYIGVDDDCQVTGVEDSKRLMEDIPNKIRDVLGIIADVRIRGTGTLIRKREEYLWFMVHDEWFMIDDGA